MTDVGVRVDRDGPVATLTLCRPQVLNAQNPRLWGQLRRIGRDLPGDVRVVVVRGEGRAFSAGLDLSAFTESADARAPRVDKATEPDAEENVAGLPGNAAIGAAGVDVSGKAMSNFANDSSRYVESHVESRESGGTIVEDASDDVDFSTLANADPEHAADLIAGFQAGYSWLRRPDIVSIAAVQGYAIGAGFQLALACDLRILASNAQLAMAEVHLGLVPDLGGTKRLVELVGYGRAMDLCVTGRRIDAAEADRIGLATQVVPIDDLDNVVRERTAQILAAPRDAVVEVKALLAAASGRGYPEQELAERQAQLRRIRDLVGLGE